VGIGTGTRATPRLATRLILATLGLLLPLYIILIAGYAAGVSEQRTSEVANSVVLGQMAASVIDGFRRDLRGIVLATSLEFGDRAQPLDQNSLGPYLDTLARDYPMLRALFVTDPQGRVVASRDNVGVGTDVASRPYIIALQAGVDSVWSGALSGLQTGAATIAHGRAIRGADGTTRGFVIAALHPQTFIDQLPVALAPDARLVLVDERGRVLFVSERVSVDQLDDLSGSPLMRTALDGSTVRLDGEATPFASGPQYGALVPVGNSGWVVGYTRPVTALESALRDRLLQQALAITVVMGAAAVIIAYLTRRLLRPLRTLVAAAGAVARGERARVGVEGGDADVLALAGAMDEMSRAVADREEALRDETRLVETLRNVGETLAAELDLERLVQAATDAATDVTGAAYGAFFYNLIDEHGESYTLYTLSGAPREAFEHFPMPRITAIFGPTYRGEGVVRLDDVTQDERYGHNVPYKGMPEGHLPVRSYLAVPVVSRSGEVLGGLFFGHSRVGVFTERAERLATGIAAQAAVAIDNARLYRQAQEAIRLRDQFLSIASHELRTPIAAIKATAQAALRARSRGVLDEERVDRSFQSIAATTDHVARLASDLLDVARLRSGSMPMLRESIALGPLLERLANAYRDQWADQHELIVYGGAESAPVAGDRDRLEQVFANLLDNAAKYSPLGSPIRLTIATEGGGVRIAVIDRGIGLPEGTAHTLFQPFSRAPNAVARHIQGLGLGLYIARQVIENHAGRIWCESSGEGEGSTFYVWLPLVTSDQRIVEAVVPVRQVGT
jgi:signal transduction histidine kinase